jgi:hypothetical protein
VDVNWLKFWVQVVVRGRDEQYRDGEIKRVFIVWIEMKP